MFTFFSEPETHPEAKSIHQYYKDVQQAIDDVNAAVPNANQDPGFSQAARVLKDVVDLCRDMETVPALEAKSKNDKRKELMPGIGDDGIINVTGEASKLLAQKYASLLQAVVNKEYWPVKDCPSLLGQSFLSVYASGFEKRSSYYQLTINELNNRVAHYDHSLRLSA